MKKSLLAMAIALTTINVAHAETSGMYVGGQLGSGLIDMDAKVATLGDYGVHLTAKQNKLVGAINVGYNFKSQFDLPIRTELSYTARGKGKFKGEIDSDIIKQNTRINTLMVNTYYDIYTGSDFTPYISLGLGTAFVNNKLADDAGNNTSSSSKRNFAYSTALGVNYKITDNWSADFMARGTYNGKVKMTDKVDSMKSQTYDVMVGVLYNF